MDLDNSAFGNIHPDEDKHAGQYRDKHGDIHADGQSYYDYDCIFHQDFNADAELLADVHPDRHTADIHNYADSHAYFDSGKYTYLYKHGAANVYEYGCKHFDAHSDINAGKHGVKYSG